MEDCTSSYTWHQVSHTLAEGDSLYTPSSCRASVSSSVGFLTDAPLLSSSRFQSHDQVTVLFFVPDGTAKEHMEIQIEREWVSAGIRGREPILKGSLYQPIVNDGSMWQIERPPQLRRARSRSGGGGSPSPTSSISSYQLVNAPPSASSGGPSFSEPASSPPASVSLSSSISLPPKTSRLVTIHLEKMVPSLVVHRIK